MSACTKLDDLTDEQLAALRTIAGKPPESERSAIRRRAWIATVTIPRMVLVMAHGEAMLAELGEDCLGLIEEHAENDDPVPIVTFSPYGAHLMRLTIHNREIVEDGVITDHPWWDHPEKPEPQPCIPRRVEAWAVETHRPLRKGEIAAKEEPKAKPQPRGLKGGL